MTSHYVFDPKELFPSSAVALSGPTSVLWCCGGTDNDPRQIRPRVQVCDDLVGFTEGNMVISWDLPAEM